jgi:hypothetical protein
LINFRTTKLTGHGARRVDGRRQGLILAITGRGWIKDHLWLWLPRDTDLELFDIVVDDVGFNETIRRLAGVLDVQECVCVFVRVLDPLVFGRGFLIAGFYGVGG